ncbi:MAG TPA: hypothetical protein VF077_08930 [Nitrospiraceae bacterium]
MPEARDPVIHRDGQWWWWDETWSNLRGPHKSEQEARDAMKAYCIRELNIPPRPTEWSCDNCHKIVKPGNLIYDCKTMYGSWGWLCATCWPDKAMFGDKLGTGKGQEFRILLDHTLFKLRG